MLFYSAKEANRTKLFWGGNWIYLSRKNTGCESPLLGCQWEVKAGWYQTKFQGPPQARGTPSHPYYSHITPLPETLDSYGQEQLMPAAAPPAPAPVSTPGHLMGIQPLQHWRWCSHLQIILPPEGIFNGYSYRSLKGKQRLQVPGAVISWDRHQVLDTFRISAKRVVKASNGVYPKETQDVLQTVHQLPNCKIAQIVLSYCHIDYTVQNVCATESQRGNWRAPWKSWIMRWTQAAFQRWAKKDCSSFFGSLHVWSQPRRSLEWYGSADGPGGPRCLGVEKSLISGDPQSLKYSDPGGHKAESCEGGGYGVKNMRILILINQPGLWSLWDVTRRCFF